MTNTVFISYSSKDIQTVKKITQTLSEAGISYWKAPDMIPAGSNYAREIPRAIEKCQVFLLILSEASQQSIWVEKEVDCAVNDRKTIVPLNISGAKLTDVFRFYLNNVQTIPYYEDQEQAIGQLLDRLGKLLGIELPCKEVKKEETEREVQLPKIEKKAGEGTSRLERNNALKINQIPVICKQCGATLKQVFRGVYRCPDCGFEDYDSYQKVRNYLDKEGPRSITDIMRATGVPRATIEYFLKDERLEIPLGSPILLVCAGCGAGIRSGVFCEKCKLKNPKPDKKKEMDNQYRFFK